MIVSFVERITSAFSRKLTALTTMTEYVCPCCGYVGLSSLPYANANGRKLIRGVSAPYSVYFGMPSYEACSCCGFEFGNDDEPGTAPPVTFEQFLAEWIQDGMKWFEAAKRPVGWSLDEQLSRAS